MIRSLAFTAIFSVVLSTGTANAQTPLAGDLKLVPPDAAVFGFVDVAKVLKSKIGDAIRNLEVPNETGVDEFDKKPANANAAKTVKPFGEFVKKFKDATGIDLETIKTATFYIPKVKGPGDESTFVLALTLPPYEQAKLLSGLAKLDESFKDVKVVGPGMVDIGRNGFRLAFPSETRIIVMGNQVKEIPSEQTGKVGVIAPALEAVSSGKAAVLALNFANFPEEIKGDDLPAEARPFAPLIKSELSYATFDLEGDSIAAIVKIKNDSRAKSIESEKALAALVNFARTGLAVAQVQLERESGKDKSLEPIVDLVTSLQAAVKTATYASDDSEARLDIKMKANSPFASAIYGALTSARSGAARSQTANNLKQIGLAMHNFESAYRHLPPAAICDKNGKPLLSWRVAILPFIEQDNLYKQFKLDEPWDSEHNMKLAEYKIKVYTMPGDEADGKTRFRVFVGGDDKIQAAFDWKKGVKIVDFSDGTSNTALVVTAKEKVIWTKPDELTYDPKGNPSTHLYFQNNVTPIVMGDGSVRYVKNSLPAETWRALMTRNGGEIVNFP